MMEGTSRKIAAIPYYGGKFRMARHIVPVIASIPHKTYVETCAGGASVFFWREPDKRRVDVLNDINKDIFAIYRAFKLHPMEMAAEIEAMPYCAALYEECKAVRTQIFSLDKADLVKRGAASYFHICTTFANIHRPSGLNFDRKGTVSFARRWANKRCLLPMIIKKLATTHIETTDILLCILKWDSPDTLFYIDPPYQGTDCDGYSDSVDMNQLTMLLMLIQGKYVLSGNSQSPRPPNARQVSTTALINTVAHTHKTTECLWTNYQA